MLIKIMGDPTFIVPLEDVGVEESLTYEEVSVEILDWQIKLFRNNKIVSIIV